MEKLDKIKKFWIVELRKYMNDDEMKYTKSVGNSALGSYSDWEDKLKQRTLFWKLMTTFTK